MSESEVTEYAMLDQDGQQLHEWECQIYGFTYRPNHQRTVTIGPWEPITDPLAPVVSIKRDHA